jgi:magnesium-transporting ATPase (P-type)
MERDPRGRDEPIIDKKILSMIAVTGPLAAVIMLPVFFLNIENFAYAQTMLFMALAFFELAMFQVIRRDYGLRLKHNLYLVAAMLASSLTHLAILYTPLSKLFQTVPLKPHHWLQVAVVLTVFTAIEYGFRKLLSKKYGNRIEV